MPAVMDCALPASRNRLPLLALLGANAISLVGDELAFIALPWFVLQTTGSAAKTGLVGLSEVLPAILAAFFGGAVVDRLGFKRTSVAADVLSGVAVAMVPLCYHTVGLAFWQLLLLVFLATLLAAPGGTARQSLLPDLAALASLPWERANTAYASIQRFAQLLGPLLAGFLIAVLGASNVLWLDAATFAVSAALVAAAAPPKRGQERTGTRYFAEIREGLRFIRQDRVLRSLAIVSAFAQFLDAPLFAVVLPVYAKQVFGRAQDLGVIFAGAGAGALLGLALYGWLGPRLPRRATFVACLILFKLPWWVLALLPPLPVTVAAILVSGAAAGPIGPLIMTVRQERVPAELRGRVFGTFGAIALLGLPLGMPLTGYLIQAVGVRAALVLNTACYQAVGIAALLVPSLSEMNDRRAVGAGERAGVA